MKFLRKHIFTIENLLALIIALILMAVIVFTTQTPPSWIYQGF